MSHFENEGKANSAYTRTPTTSFLYDVEGNRKYLTQSERRAFLAAASHMPPKVRTFCRTLAYTGARVSEVLALTPQRIDIATRVVVIESLKKRRRGVYRAVPVPLALLKELDSVHNIRPATQRPERADERLWDCSRTTAWNWIKACMKVAGIDGAPASPKGLRHAFGVGALQSGVPINFVRKWLGHARLSTTEIYTNAVGHEERTIAKKLWATF